MRRCHPASSPWAEHPRLSQLGVPASPASEEDARGSVGKLDASPSGSGTGQSASPRPQLPCARSILAPGPGGCFSQPDQVTVMEEPAPLAEATPKPSTAARSSSTSTSTTPLRLRDPRTQLRDPSGALSAPTPGAPRLRLLAGERKQEPFTTDTAKTRKQRHDPGRIALCGFALLPLWLLAAVSHSFPPPPLLQNRQLRGVAFYKNV